MLEKCKTLTAEGGVSFELFPERDLETVLVTSIDWNDKIPSCSRHSIVSEAICQAGIKGKITNESLLKEIRRIESEYLKNPSVRYMLVSTLSMKWSDELRPVTVLGVRFSFHARIPRQVDFSAVQWGLDVSNTTSPHPAGYTVVCGKVLAKSPEEASSLVLTALDVLRGIWNYVLNRKTISIIHLSGGDWKPLNQIRLGPVHTVHLSNGKPATQMWWGEQGFSKGKVADLAEKWDAMTRQVTWHLGRSKRLPYDAVGIWTRYVRAFDHADQEASFLRLWSLLELLTVTNSEGYVETIKRTLFVFEDQELHRLILNHLRDCRNALVHRDESQEQVEQHVFQLKRYVEALMRLHFAMAGKFNTLDEVREFLSLPADPKLLKSRKQLISHGIKFRTKRRK